MPPLNTNSVLVSGKMKMPVIGLGTWQCSNDEVQDAVEAALEAGYRHIDTTSNNEEGIGKVLKNWFDTGKLKREDVFISTKCNPTHFRPEHIEKSLDGSLMRLQLDYVDLFLAHSPVGLAYLDEGYPFADGKMVVDMTTNLENNWETMEEMVHKGKTKSIGVSNFKLSQVKRILDVAKIKPANNQVELNVYFQQPELVKFCQDNDVVICAYAPLGSPNMKEFTESRGFSAEGMNLLFPLENPVVSDIATKHGKTTAQVLLRFLLQYGVAVIPKSSNPDHIKQNLNIFDFELPEEEYKQMQALDKGKKGRQFGGEIWLFATMSSHPEYPF